MRIGVDVGGTNTDAVLVDGREVLAAAKTPTTPDVTEGIAGAIRELVSTSGTAVSGVQAVMIGTTHFTNAVVEARRLAPTGVIRLGLPATEALPPFVGWPPALRDAISRDVRLCHGGHEFDGRRISAVDPEELRRAAADYAAKEIRTVALSSVFSPVNAEAELEAAAILGDELPGTAISLSHEIGRIGLLER
ncbi:MAG TPA: hydantoinase/oxoprolinase N-terminal domain-containing protein, partial [Gaiellaceae bacterium]|nr:hydantoinase/oxoprolinase N-terminal domain-containing protein [Gaiellaceae bacterium]